MSKRRLSPALLPPAKRLHIHGGLNHYPGQILSFDNSLYDELILCIFSHLSWVDLCVTQNTNRNWARLAADNELWREKYLSVYSRNRLRGAKGFIGRLDGREVRPLPGRAKTDHYRDWKWMFRISSNWRKGRCSAEEFFDPSVHAQPPMDLDNHAETDDDYTHIILAGPLIITASSRLSHRPSIAITSQSNQQHIFPYHDDQSQHEGAACVTALALDQSPPVSGHLSLACFSSAGDFSVFDFNPASPSHSITRKYKYHPPRRVARKLNIIQAVYYYPLIVTVSDIFSVSIYDLSSGVVRHTQTLSSFTSYPPASLVLSSPSSMLFKLVIAYSIPVYPKHWSIGATELMISKGAESSGSNTSSLTTFSSPSFREDYKYPLAITMSVITSRTIRAFDVPSGWVDEMSLRAMREQWGRKVLDVGDAQTDGKWVVLAPGSSAFHHYGRGRPSLSPPPSSSASSLISSSLHSPTSLQLYRLLLPTQSNAVSASPPKLNFVRTLHGQTSPVSALALADGRCVSLGQNGSIWVWDLEVGTGAEVAPADETTLDGMLRPIRGTVSFDERRIVTAYNGKHVVRRFDV